MTRDRLLQKTSIAIVLVCCLVLVVTLCVVVTSAIARGRDEATSYVPGDQIDLPVSVYEGADLTAILFLSPTCPACLESRQELARLVRELERVPGSKVVLVKAGRIGEQGDRLETDLGLEQRNVFALDLRGLRLKHVPTVVAVDRRGKILFSKVGLISPGDSMVGDVLNLRE